MIFGFLPICRMILPIRLAFDTNRKLYKISFAKLSRCLNAYILLISSVRHNVHTTYNGSIFAFVSVLILDKDFMVVSSGALHTNIRKIEQAK